MTKTEIINKALTLIGASPIVNITDETNNARIMSRIYDISLRSMLSECGWNFAMKRRLLATSSDSLEWYDSGVSILYGKPSDCIRIFGTNDDNAVWREEGEYIISDTADLGIKYVYYLDTPSKYPASFVDALVDRLAADAAFMILNSKTIAQSYLEKYEKVSLVKARSENAQIGTQQYLKDDAWLGAKDTGRADRSYG
jgi:hypothetical protein